MPQKLVTCPICHTPNFTPRGLKAHKCKGALKMNHETGLVEVLPPPSDLHLPSPAIDPQTAVDDINALHRAATYLSEKARDLGRQATMKAIILGVKLAALKDATPHGQWESMFASGMKRVGKSNVAHAQHLLEIDHSTATRYIAVAANIMAQRLSPAQNAALMQIASRPMEEELPAVEIDFLEDVTPEKSLRRLYLNLGIIKPTLKEARAMQDAEDAANRDPEPEAPKKKLSMAESMQRRKDEAREYWFGTKAAGMVNPSSVLHAIQEECRNPAEAHLSYLHKTDLIELETDVKNLLKIIKQLIAES